MQASTFYRNKLVGVEAELKLLQKKLNRNTLLRLISFLAIFLFLFGLAQLNLYLAITLSVLSVIVFGFLVKNHIYLQQLKKHKQAEANILENELDAINYVFTSFRAGDEYINTQHRFSHDLDLFGNGSLFQMINRSVTQSGELNLAKHLSVEQTIGAEVRKMQQAVQELSENPDLLIYFRSTGSLSGITFEDKKLIHEWRNEPLYIAGKNWINIIRYLFPGFTLLSLLFLIITGAGASVFTSLFVINLMLSGRFYKATTKEHNKLSAFLKVFGRYKDLLAIFERQTFKSEILKKLLVETAQGEHSAANSLEKLTKAGNAFDNRLNLVAGIFLQGLFLYDYHCLVKIEKWRKTYGRHLPVWLQNIAQFDSYVSLATFAYNNSDFVYPEPVDTLVLRAEEMGHPFIPASVRVPNNFELIAKGEFAIITGANMAGKSTFLRTVGINLVLAMSGLPVCAKNFEFTPRKIFSSMRTSDSLNENESYFYAELKRLKQLIDRLKEEEDLFILLDEILKGTNSVDKQKGSQLALEKILKLKGTGIIATHDLALTDMEKSFPNQIKNQCFEIEIEKAKIEFDYKLYDGVTKNMNAMLLMEQMGIIEKPES